MNISIITPTFNAIKFIDACVANVQSQGEVVLEHLIADGGSTDGTVERIGELSRTNSKIRFLAGPDGGQSDAMNKATAVARGDAIGILNVDDFYEPGVVARGVAELSTLSRPGLVAGDCRILDGNGRTITWNRPTDLRIEALLLNSHHFAIPANPSAYFYHREVHDIVGGYDVDDHYSMDAEFLFRCAERVETRYVAEHWGNFRLIPGAKTFDDGRGPQRVRELVERHVARLTPRQRLTMRRIWRTKQARIVVGRFLRRVGLR